MGQHQVIARRGYEMVEQVLDIGPDVTPEVEQAYMGGQCLALALVLSKRTSWPLVVQCWGSADLIAAVGPRDGLGLVDIEHLALPEDSMHYGRAWDDVLRTNFQHAFVLSPNGAVDVRGVRPLRQLRSTPSEVSCECPPACACVLPCCTGGSGFFYARLSRQGAQVLTEPQVRPSGQVVPAVLAEQNHEAAAELADVLLDSWGLDPQRPHQLRTPARSSRPRWKV